MRHLRSCHGGSAASGAEPACDDAGALEYLRVGQRVLYRGRVYLVHGVDPMSVTNPRVYLAEREGAPIFAAPAANVEPLR
jgi:hypothetical protein